MSRSQLTSTVEQNTGGAVSPYVAGKNKIINGDFGVWQRGTSFSNPAANAYNADRFVLYFDGTGATRTISQQTFTPGTAPVPGYEGQYFFRYAQTVAGTSNTVNLLYQKIENVQTFAGQSVVLSFWAKADSARSITCTANQNFGSGGSADVDTNFTGTASVTTSWQRFSFTVAVPSISGKTIGTSSFLGIRLFLPAGTTPTIDIWGVQVEAGSVATPFTTATGTLSGELAACQRYYYRSSSTASNPYALFTQAFGANSSTQVYTSTRLPVSMRIPPTAADYANLQVADGSNLYAVTSIVLDANTSTQDIAAVGYNVSSGLTQYRPYAARGNNSSSAYLGFSAEL